MARHHSVKGKRKSFFVLLGLLFSLFLIRSVGAPLLIKSAYAQIIRTTENLRRETVLLPSSAPDKGRLAMVSFIPLSRRESEIVAWLGQYDDPQTKRAVDYVEVYDRSGDLLWVQWIDRFGIGRTALDRGLLLKNTSGPERVLVLMPEGTLS